MCASYRLEFSEESKNEKEVPFYFNGKQLIGNEYEPIAAALLANGIRALRLCDTTGEYRGVFCGIGHCYECRAEVDGIPNVRTCLTPLTEGTKVSSVPTWQIGVK
ncbi:(2Fe-2S)-binding protein [Jeotgalibacillus marinus]|uniref:(2Fe-2S)-binding protein n=1 Tax=Jeotgalibacillus marinus TaxID=86667 RepID=A0ABV3Q5M9_9BACL